MRTSALWFAFLGLGLFSVLSCSRSQNAVLTIQLPGNPSFNKVQTVMSSVSSFSQEVGFSGTYDDDVPWNGDSISVSSQINCYVVMVGGPEPEMKRNSCWDSSYQPLVQFGDYEGGIPAGSRIEITVPPGPNRQIYLLAMNATNGSCQSFKNDNLQHGLISFPRLVAQTTMDLNPGVNQANLTIPENLSSSPKIQNCRTDDNSGAAHIRPGDKLSNGTIYLGTLKPGATSGGSNVDRYVTTPGGCDDSATPTCDGESDTLTKMWSSDTGTDITGVESYADNIGIGYGATNTDQNYGDANTAVISGLDSNSAAAYCSNLSYGGYSDWFLPNRYELNLMFTNKGLISGLVTSASGNDSVYWSSSENNAAQAWAQKMSTGSQVGLSPKNYSFLVRCVRRMETPVLLISNTSSITNLDVDGTSTTDSSWKTITLTNAGELPTGDLSFSINGDSHLEYNLYTCSTAGINSGNSCILKVRASGLSTDRILSGTLTIHGANGGSVSISLGGTVSGFYDGSGPDPCNEGESPSPGDTCDGGAIYLGSLSPGATNSSGTDHYMTTPGGCTDSSTPTCSGYDSVVKIWGSTSANTSLRDYWDTNHTGTNNGEYNKDENYGDENTGVIVANASTPSNSAADYCDALDYGGYNDWYLPNRYELNLLYTKRNSIPGLKASLYWSSTEYGTINAWKHNFNTGAQGTSPKDEGKYVRCVRRY